MKTIRAFIVMLGLVLSLPFLSSVYAQVQVDASKVTCDQFVHGKLGTPRTIAAWLSGFYNGKHNNPIIDIQNFDANLIKLQDFCYQGSNFELPVMQAIEQAIVKSK